MKRILYAREDLMNNARVVPSRKVFAPHMWPGLDHLVLSLCSENNGSGKKVLYKLLSLGPFNQNLQGKVENCSWTWLTFL